MKFEFIRMICLYRKSAGNTKTRELLKIQNVKFENLWKMELKNKWKTMKKKNEISLRRNALKSLH